MNDEPTQDNLPRLEPEGDRAQGYSPLARGERELPRPVPYPEPDPGEHSPRRPVRRRKRRSPFWSTVRTGVKFGCIGLAMLLAALLGAGLIAGVVMYNSLAAELVEDLETLDSMEGVEDFETTRIYDRSGEVLLYEVFNEGRRTEVTLDRIPIKLRYATIATEDDTFYENPGFDPPSIMRAAWQWYQEGEIVSGASTITQQLVDQIVFSYEERTAQSMRVKLKEVALAWVMTQKYTKDEILELYLNEIYYGNLAYGIEEAANVYFDKPATELTLGEAAFLAGLPQSPGTYDPYNNFGMAKARQRQVLDLMVRHGYISMDEADSAFNERPVAVSDLADPAIALEAPHFTVEARRRLAELPGIEPDMIERGGLVVTTTIDMDMQAAAERIAAEHIAENGVEYNMSNAAIVALNPNTAEVLAMVGSVDYENEAIDGQVNNTLSLHQPGSSIKPLTYAVALERGWTPADILWDVPMEYSTGVGAYQPVNYDGRFHGPVRLRDALANSYNIPAVELLNQVGVENLLEIANRLGINSLEMDPARYGLSLTLGGGEVTPVEMASAFGTFANGGYQVTPQMILRVEDNAGNVLYEVPGEPGERVLDERIAFVISSMLSDNAARTPAMGSESPLLVDFPAAAKTGTTNDYRDNWTVGYTPHLVVAVWAGNTDDTPMAEGTSGLTGAAPIWHETMTAFYNMPGIEQALGGASLPLRADFTPPAGVESRQVCVLSSLTDPAPAEGGCPRQRAEWFLVGGIDPSVPPTQVPTPTPVPTLAPQPGDPDAPEAPEGPPPPIREDLGYGVLKIGVLRLEEEQQAQVVAAMADLWNALPDGVPDPAPPVYCEAAQENVTAEGLSFQLFIAAPSDPGYAVRARNWAQANGVPIEPGVPCTAELIDEVEQAEAVQVAGVSYVLNSPRRDDEVYGIVPIIATVRYEPQLVEYYKLEIGRGEQPTEWLTLGEVKTEQIEEEVIEYLHADALPDGTWILRLVLVGRDGNFINPPYAIRLNVVPEPTPES